MYYTLIQRNHKIREQSIRYLNKPYLDTCLKPYKDTCNNNNTSSISKQTIS